MFGLSDDDRKYKPVLDKFEAHFVKKRNVIYERARFNIRRQEEGEPVDAFITSMYTLAEHCGYGPLHDEMIRDRIVVGIRNAPLSEKLQLNADFNVRDSHPIRSPSGSRKAAAATSPCRKLAVGYSGRGCSGNWEDQTAI